MNVIDCVRVVNKFVYVGFECGRLSVLSYWRVLLGACLWNTSAEAFSGGVLPSADCVLGYVGAVSWREVELGFKGVVNHTLGVAKRLGWFNRPVLCAVDFHDDLYYGSECFGVVGCRTQLGTNRCFRVASLDVCEAGKRFTLAVIPVFKETSKVEVLKTLVVEARKHVKIKCLLLDRGFYSIRVFRALQSLKLRYIVCSKKTKKLLEAVENKSRVKYTLRNPEDLFTVNLVAYRPDNDHCWVYATNLHSKPETIAHTYKKRWGIETGYRSKNKYNANTTTRNYTIRLLYILLGIVLYNLWVLANLIVDTPTIKKLTQKTTYTPKITIFQHRRTILNQITNQTIT